MSFDHRPGADSNEAECRGGTGRKDTCVCGMQTEVGRQVSLLSTDT